MLAGYSEAGAVVQSLLPPLSAAVPGRLKYRLVLSDRSENGVKFCHIPLSLGKAISRLRCLTIYTL